MCEIRSWGTDSDQRDKGSLPGGDDSEGQVEAQSVKRHEKHCMYRAAILVSGAGKGVSYGACPDPLPQMCVRLRDPYACVESINRQCAGCGLAIAKWTVALPPVLQGPFI